MCSRLARINRPSPCSTQRRDQLRSLPCATRETVTFHVHPVSHDLTHSPPCAVYKTLPPGDGGETGASQIAGRKIASEESQNDRSIPSRCLRGPPPPQVAAGR